MGLCLFSKYTLIHTYLKEYPEKKKKSAFTFPFTVIFSLLIAMS